MKKRPGGFDRSKISANFAANSKSNKDTAAGWALDFDKSNTSDAGMTEDQQIAEVIRLSTQSQEEMSKTFGGDSSSAKLDAPELK